MSGGQYREPLPVAPFTAWAEGRIAAIRSEIGADYGRGGSNTGADMNYVERFMVEIGWDFHNGPRKLYRWMNPDQGDGHSGVVERAEIEDALHRAGVLFSDLYPDLDADPQALRDGYCAACRRDVNTTDGYCPWCDDVVLDARPKYSHARLGQGRRMTDAQVRAAHVLYVQRGLYLRDVAGMLWRQYGYANLQSCEAGLRRAFRLLGLPRMPPGEASRRAHTTHGLTVQGRKAPEYTALVRERELAKHGVCGETRYDGTPCEYVCEPGTSTCGYHNPDKLAARRANLATARAALGMAA